MRKILITNVVESPSSSMDIVREIGPIDYNYTKNNRRIGILRTMKFVRFDLHKPWCYFVCVVFNCTYTPYRP